MKVAHNRTERWQAFAAAAGADDDAIRAGYAAKRRPRDIAAELGGEWTGMRVAYRAKKLGLEPRLFSETARRNGFTPPAADQSRAARMAGGIATSILRGSARARAIAMPERTAAPLRLEDVAERGCRYAIGDPRIEGFRYCNAPRAAGPGVYCLACRQVAYRRLKAEPA
jgi:hypothetical protein